MAKHEATTLAARLRSARIAAGLSQSELTERSGVPIQTIHALEQGRRVDPHVSTLVALARALNVTVDHLAGL